MYVYFHVRCYDTQYTVHSTQCRGRESERAFCPTQIEGENWQRDLRGASHKSRNRGWTSADRSTKATLMLTVPRSIVKSSTEDLTRPTFWIAVKYRVDPKAIVTPTPVEVNIVASSMDSDLEAFSHNPTDDSFAALAAQPTALPNIRTNGSSRTKLDYCRDNQLISRVKLTCLTTV